MLSNPGSYLDRMWNQIRWLGTTEKWVRNPIDLSVFLGRHMSFPYVLVDEIFGKLVSGL